MSLRENINNDRDWYMIKLVGCLRNFPCHVNKHKTNPDPRKANIANGSSILSSLPHQLLIIRLLWFCLFKNFETTEFFCKFYMKRF